MLYDRKIKYVDYYENGERLKGGGFVKLEVRDGFLKMDLHIKGLYPTDSFVRDVVLKGSETEAVLGQITLREGAGSFNYSCEMPQGIGGTGISYEDLREIKIPVGGSRELCCTWEKIVNKATKPVEPPEADDLERESSAAESTETESIESGYPELEGMAKVSPMTTDEGVVLQETQAQQRDTQQQETQKTEVQEAETQEAELRQAEAGETELQEAVAREAVDQEAAVQESMSKGVGQRSEKPEQEYPVLEGSGRQDDKNEPEQKSAVKLLEDKWQQLSAIYPHIRPFNDEREFLSLSPSDFVLFPESYYRAANNSFLLHGFYNYKHLILARVERRSEVRYYLGVPGNYYEREKQVAVMFGFESFECDREPAKTGDFGYYLMRMEL